MVMVIDQNKPKQSMEPIQFTSLKQLNSIFTHPVSIEARIQLVYYNFCGRGKKHEIKK